MLPRDTYIRAVSYIHMYVQYCHTMYCNNSTYKHTSEWPMTPGGVFFLDGNKGWHFFYLFVVQTAGPVTKFTYKLQVYDEA